MYVIAVAGVGTLEMSQECVFPRRYAAACACKLLLLLLLRGCWAGRCGPLMAFEIFGKGEGSFACIALVVLMRAAIATVVMLPATKLAREGLLACWTDERLRDRGDFHFAGL